MRRRGAQLGAVVRAAAGAGRREQVASKGLKQGAEARRDLWQLLQRPEATLRTMWIHVDSDNIRHPFLHERESRRRLRVRYRGTRPAGVLLHISIYIQSMFSVKFSLHCLSFLRGRIRSKTRFVLSYYLLPWYSQVIVAVGNAL